jgi:hypothetical protein
VPHEGGGAIPNQWMKGRDGRDKRRYLAPGDWRCGHSPRCSCRCCSDGIGGLLGVEQFKTTAAGNSTRRHPTATGDKGHS